MDQVLTSLAEFASEFQYRDLPAPVVAAAKQRLLDTLGCAIDAHDCDTAKLGRQVAAIAAGPEYEGRVLGSEKTLAADDAAFINSCMIRHTGLNDIIPGGHPSDMLGGLFAVAPQIQASGEKLITATVVAYETLIRLKLAAPIRDKGWDQSFGVAVGAAAGLARLMGLNRDAARDAISITAVGNTAMRATRAGQLSMWNRGAAAGAVRNAMYNVHLARAGMTGPEAPFTGRDGFAELIAGGPLEFKPFGRTADDFFIHTLIKSKYWPVANSLQAVIWAGIELRKQVSADQLASVVVSTYRFSWRESGSEPAKWDPTTRETADHSIPYILVRSLLHGVIDQASSLPDAYLDPAIRPLMAKVDVRPDDAIEQEYENGTYHLRVNATDKSGKSYEVNVVNPPGHECNPLSAQDLAMKFSGLCEPKLGKERMEAALRQWQDIEKEINTRSAFDALVLHR